MSPDNGSASTGSCSVCAFIKSPHSWIYSGGLPAASPTQVSSRSRPLILPLMCQPWYSATGITGRPNRPGRRTAAVVGEDFSGVCYLDDGIAGLNRHSPCPAHALLGITVHLLMILSVQRQDQCGECFSSDDAHFVQHGF